jgi:hypothetical protein
MRVNKKLIKILSRGPIYEKNGVYGPITVPYVENVRTIFLMLRGGKFIVEVLPNGEEVKLTISNFDQSLLGNVEKIEPKILVAELVKNDARYSINLDTVIPTDPALVESCVEELPVIEEVVGVEVDVDPALVESCVEELPVIEEVSSEESSTTTDEKKDYYKNKKHNRR